MVCAKSFSDNQLRVNSIDFTPDGQFMLTSSDDDSIAIYNCQQGSKARAVRKGEFYILLFV